MKALPHARRSPRCTSAAASPSLTWPSFVTADLRLVAQPTHDGRTADARDLTSRLRAPDARVALATWRRKWCPDRRARPTASWPSPSPPAISTAPWRQRLCPSSAWLATASSTGGSQRSATGRCSCCWSSPKARGAWRPTSRATGRAWWRCTWSDLGTCHRPGPPQRPPRPVATPFGRRGWLLSHEWPWGPFVIALEEVR